MTQSAPDSGLERWRQYLLLLARVQLGPARRGQPEASDLVQQTLLDAFRTQEQFRGKTDAERAAWLRRILACNLADALRTGHRAKRNVDKERSIESAMDQSSMQLGSLLAAPDTSPSIRAGRNEQLVALADALAALNDSWREAIVLHYFQGWSLDRIGLQMDRTPAAVAGLLKRGLKQLRGLLIPEDA